VVPKLFVTVDWQTLDNFTLPQAGSSVSMERIDQSHAQKANGVTTNINFVISQPGG